MAFSLLCGSRFTFLLFLPLAGGGRRSADECATRVGEGLLRHLLLHVLDEKLRLLHALSSLDPHTRAFVLSRHWAPNGCATRKAALENRQTQASLHPRWLQISEAARTTPSARGLDSARRLHLSAHPPSTHKRGDCRVCCFFFCFALPSSLETSSLPLASRRLRLTPLSPPLSPTLSARWRRRGSSSRLTS